ncbi:MAG TPA: hypothetical protein VFA67_13215 [Candidatus Sulfotelmatobacter sp.]|nr:hypothetical protein [Candidatus Sulfotelmatobacter sp.]
MKNLIKPAAVMALLCGVALAQSTAPAATDPGTPQPQAQPTAPQDSQSRQAPAATSATQASTPHATRIAPGSVIPVQLTKTIDAKKAKTGDEVVAKVTMDMKTQTGDVLVPKDTKVIGHVTEAQARNKEQKESQLAIAFDHAVTKDGNNMQLPMSIQAVIGQQPNQESEANTPAGREQAAGVPSGAAPTGAAGNKSSGSSGMSGTTPPSSPAPAGAGAADTQANGGRPQITGQTQGVVGISNLTLSPAANGAQGSVMTSQKNNVKLESGTMLLLKVNP